MPKLILLEHETTSKKKKIFYFIALLFSSKNFNTVSLSLVPNVIVLKTVIIIVSDVELRRIDDQL